MSNHPLPIPLLGLCASGRAFAKQNYRALWVMMCPLILYCRWLEAESTPLPPSSVPMHFGKRSQFLPYSCSQGRGQGSHPPSRRMPCGRISFCEEPQWALTRKAGFKCQGCAWAERRWLPHSDHTTWQCKGSAPSPNLPILLRASGSESWDASGMSLLKPLFLCLKTLIL